MQFSLIDFLSIADSLFLGPQKWCVSLVAGASLWQHNVCREP